MDILSELSAQAEEAEVFSLQNESTIIQYEANELKSCNVAETRGLAARILRGGRLGFAASTDLTAQGRLAAKAIESSDYGEEAPFTFPAPRPAPEVDAYDRSLAGLSIKELVDLGKEVVEMVRQADPLASCRIWLDRKLSSTGIRNQRGLDVSFETSPFLLRLQADRIEGDDVLSLVDVYGTTRLDGGHLEAARRLADKLVLGRRIVDVKPGRMPVLFSPAAIMTLTLPLCEALNGAAIRKGSSPLGDRLGEKIFDGKLGLEDDGTLAGRFSSAARDDEGIPRRRNVLVEGGVLKGYIHDLRSAGQLGADPSGNASRGDFSPFTQPEPAYTNLVLAAGSTPLKEIIASMGKGILVESALGLGIGNTISGAISNPLALAFRIERGEIVGRAKDLSIAGNIYDLLADISAVSRERHWVETNIHSPYILIPEMNVAGKG